MNQAALDATMELEPTLTSHGFVYGGDRSCMDLFWRKKTDAEKKQEFDKDRERLRTTDLGLLTKIEVLLRGAIEDGSLTAGSYEGGSYGLKHVAERILGQYVSNGQLIVVGVHLMFPYRVEGPNAVFKMSKSCLRHLYWLEKNAISLRRAGVLSSPGSTVPTWAANYRGEGAADGTSTATQAT